MACVSACVHGRILSHSRLQARAYPGGADTPSPSLSLGTCSLPLPPVVASRRQSVRRSNPQPSQKSALLNRQATMRTTGLPLPRSHSIRNNNTGITRAQSLRCNPSMIKRYPSCKIWDPRTWVVFKPEEDFDEKETAFEIEAGSVKASIPIARPFSKPISITRKPSLLRSASSCLALSLALSVQFPISLPVSDNKELLVPIGLSLTLTLSLLPFLAAGAVPATHCAEGAVEVSVGQAQATIPLCIPSGNHMHSIHSLIPRAASLVKHLSHHQVAVM